MKLAMDMLDSEMVVGEENDLQIRRHGKNWIIHATCIVNSCHGMVNFKVLVSFCMVFP